MRQLRKHGWSKLVILNSRPCGHNQVKTIIGNNVCSDGLIVDIESRITGKSHMTGTWYGSLYGLLIDLVMSWNCMFKCYFIAPSAPPRNVMPTTTFRSITVTWDTITCIERNGIITSYTVEFGLSGNPTMRTGITELTFTVNGLTPFTNYTFRVVNWS